MSLFRTIQIRLSKEQKDRIKNDAMISGFNSISAYLRYLALGRNYILERKINEIHEIITGKKDKKKIKIRSIPPFINT